MALAALDVLAHELALFACLGFLIGGIDDLAIDLIFFAKASWRPLPDVAPRHAFAIFVPAWDEAPVIGAMLTETLRRFGDANYNIYVGCYPNDAATVRAVSAIAAGDPRVRIVLNPRAGPTTKGDNLNALWRALCRDEAAEGRRAEAVVLHDAEDVVHPDALRLFDHLLIDHAFVQLPVLPLIDLRSRWISAHYADEFSESHMRTLVARQAVGAALPLAGVGCALRRDALDAVAGGRSDGPFDAASLTEDYELGLAIAKSGGRGCFARYRDRQGGAIVTRAIFPGTLQAARRQKGRWLAGIALIGWDRLGWGGRFAPAELWMRMRDRRSLVATLVLAVGYLAVVVGGVCAMLHLAVSSAPARPDPLIATLMAASSLLLGWRMANRAATTTLYYGWREGLRSLPRTVVGNVVALFATGRALAIYFGSLRGRPIRWDKTAHVFPVGRAA